MGVPSHCAFRLTLYLRIGSEHILSPDPTPGSGPRQVVAQCSGGSLAVDAMVTSPQDPLDLSREALRKGLPLVRRAVRGIGHSHQLSPCQPSEGSWEEVVVN